MDVPATSVIRVVLQYLQESNLPVAFEALQRESGVPLNAVPGDATAAQAAPDAAALGAQAPFFADVLAGRWDKALPAAAAFELPAPVAAALYEHVVLELVEHRDANSARAMLRSTVALGTWMRRHEPQRYARLDNLVKRCGTLNGTREVYGDTDRDARRRALALQLHGEVSVAAPGRLLDLVGCGLRYLRVTGRMFELAPHVRKRARGGGDGGAAGGPPLAWDLLMNTELAPLAKARRRDADGDEAPVIPPLADGARHAQAIRFGSTSHPTCASYSPDGFFLATGSSDGFVELWDARTCKLATSLAYQKRDEMLAHDACVTCVAFSRDGELLASGDAAGTLKVWRVASGRCLRKWEAVHGAQQPVRAAVFSEDASAGGGPDAAALAIVSVGGSAGDGAAKLLGLKGGAVLRDYALGRASTARLRVDGAPSAAVYLHPFGGGATLLAVGTTDGRVCVFAAKSGEHVRTFEVPQYREGEPRWCTCRRTRPSPSGAVRERERRRRGTSRRSCWSERIRRAPTSSTPRRARSSEKQ